jgi:LmbE family N-acetylglucosaminyl deacetylase
LNQCRLLALPVLVLLGFFASGWIATSASQHRAPRLGPSQSVLDFFVVAQEDDWQLFMSPSAITEQRIGRRVVIIIVTAGDAGNPRPYWTARERGAINSQKVLANVDGPIDETAANIDGHVVHRLYLGNTALYFLRCPDGNVDTGKGFPLYHYESIEQLRDAGKPATTVDGETVYKSWAELCATIRTIMISESKSVSTVLLSTFDYDKNLNPGDHCDHIATAQAAAAAATYGWFAELYLGYESSNRPRNVSAADFATKAAALKAYDEAMTSASYTSDYSAPAYQERIWRQYFRMSVPK